jgi:putative transposase
MNFEPRHLFHIYNQGNNRQKIYFGSENYRFFLKKIETHILPFADILAWCLIPNNFHLMVHVNEPEVDERLVVVFPLWYKNSGITCINNSDPKNDYPNVCFNYILFNPIKDGLVSRPEEWKFSSYNEVSEIRTDNLIALKESKNMGSKLQPIRLTKSISK